MIMMDHTNKLLLSGLLGQMWKCVCELLQMFDSPEHPGNYEYPSSKVNAHRQKKKQTIASKSCVSLNIEEHAVFLNSCCTSP